MEQVLGEKVGCRHVIFAIDRFFLVGDQIAGGQQYLLLRALSGRARVLIVEKPGCHFSISQLTPARRRAVRRIFCESTPLFTGPKR